MSGDGGPGRPWLPAVAVVAVAALLVGGGVFALRSLLSVPSQVAREARELAGDLRSVAAAFRTGTITTSFATYASELTGSARLQFATLRQVEAFERTDSVAILWGQLALPDVVVEARAPVEYTYYLDLKKRWTFRLEGSTLYVAAPAVEFNTPAIDASAIRYEVRAGSVFRDEAAVLDKLKSGLTELSRMRARANLGLVREVGRRETEAFVEAWLARAFSDGRAHRVRVVFPDEAAQSPRPLG